MKMTKIAFWRKVKENCGTTVLSPKNGCNGIDCDLCPVKSQEMCDLCYVEKNFKKALAYANKQIKIHESKSRKKVKIDLSPYMKKETARLKAEKKKPAVKTDVRDMKNVVKDETVKESLKVDPTSLDIAKAIRDNDYKCGGLNGFGCGTCFLSPISCGNGERGKTLIDAYISDHEKVGPVMPEPIKFSDNVPAFVYMVTEKAIKKEKAIAFLQRKTESGIVERIVFDYGGEHTFENCYKTLADAVGVAEKMWFEAAK